jgi:lipoyl synthase
MLFDKDRKLIFPSWIKVKALKKTDLCYIQDLNSQFELKTVCVEANCPNIGECWSKKHAAFIVMGGICTRKCRFCNIPNGKPLPLDQNEPKNIAIAVRKLDLKYVVITSVDRDDLIDGGANHFVQIINEIRKISNDISIEILTPDFLNKNDSWKIIVEAGPDVFNHNIETVKRLFPNIKIGANYKASLELLKSVKKMDSNMFTKSGIIVGLGETNEEIFQTMDDLRNANVDFLTIGQYLKPKTTDKNISKRLIEIQRFVTPEEFTLFEKIAYEKGFKMVSSSPLTRSSYHAEKDFQCLKRT